MSAPKKPPTPAKPAPADDGSLLAPLPNETLAAWGKRVNAARHAAPSSTPTPTPTATPAPSPAPSPPAQQAPNPNQENPDIEVLSPDTIENTLSGLRDLSTYQSNILNQFGNRTYHARLFMTPDRDVILAALGKDDTPKSAKEYYDLLDSWQQVTIAETGVTGYNIKDVQIESLCSPNFQSVALNTTAIMMNITEPSGVTFLDSLKNAAIQMRVRDMRKCWYYLEITFKGYSDGEPNPNLLSDASFDNGGRWIWQVQITDIETKLSTGGGEYKCSMIPYSETVLDAEGRCVPDMMIAEGETIKDFFVDLATQLNRSWFIRTANNNYLAYDFKFHGVKGRPAITGDAVQGWSLVSSEIALDYIKHLDLQANANGGTTSPDGKDSGNAEKTETVSPPSDPPPISISSLSGKPRGQFARGTTIDEIVTTVFSCCKEAQYLIKDSKNDDFSPDDEADTGSAEGKVNSKGFRESIIFRVEPEVRVLNYDPAFNKYGKKVTYHVYGYVTQTPIISRTQVLSANNPDVQKRMIATLVQQGLLRKKYDYLYTGLNDSVIDLDISFNMLWAAALPRLLRNEALTAQSAFDESVIKKYDVIAEYGALASDRAVLIENLQSANDAHDTEEASKIQNKLASTEAELSQKRSELTQLRDRLLAALPQLDASTARNGARLIAEDIEVDSLPSLNDFSITMQYSQDEPKNALATGMVGQSHNGRAIFGAVVNQLEGAMTNQMMSITMKIVGDPYWMGPANMEQIVIRANDLKTDKLADFTIGDNVFTLEFAYPLGINDDGSPKMKKSELFTGLYRVTKVTNEFANGIFTQNLEAIRMPLIDLFRATASTETT